MPAVTVSRLHSVSITLPCGMAFMAAIILGRRGVVVIWAAAGFAGLPV